MPSPGNYLTISRHLIDCVADADKLFSYLKNIFALNKTKKKSAKDFGFLISAPMETTQYFSVNKY